MSATVSFAAAAVTVLVVTLPCDRAVPAVRRVQGPGAQMAPLEQYLMADRDAEVALARSAAPAAIAEHAEVRVLGRHGYATAVSGTNGFVCVVEPSFTSPFDSPTFWDTRLHGPVCYNPAAARSVLPLVERRAALVLAGLPKDQVLDSLRADRHHPVAPGAMSFMLSRHGVLNDAGTAWRPHLMFYLPLADSTALAADVPGSPVIGQNQQFAAEGSGIGVFVVAVSAWSDGSMVQRSRSSQALGQPRRHEAD